MFNIDLFSLGTQLLPVRWRKPRMSAWIRCLLTPLNTLYTLFLNNRSGNHYRLSHTGQVCSLEALLNDAYDPGRHISIEDGPFLDPLFIYIPDEDRDVPISLVSELPHDDYEAPIYLLTVAETATEAEQFVVRYPTSISASFDEIRWRALIDQYRLVGKNTYSFSPF
ncbi:hypothetical protein GCM10023093_17110 [Nemorincola caseinilytica]|uniref:Uncharacterized protein n=1 Tax=Nemorincola caseinilytica TaxID=2054315 RepID=A0ABP8NG26_9BACT